MTLKRFIAGAALAGGLDIPWQGQPGYYGAVRDHRPFEYQGQWVNPVFDAGHQGWGFWLGPVWIPLL